MTQEINCIFCSIIAGKAPSSIVLEDELVLAILTIRPLHPGHTLLLPKIHVEDISLLSTNLRNHLFEKVVELKKIICSTIPCEGFNLLLNQGLATGQKVGYQHLHLHLIPRSVDKPIDFNQRAQETPRKDLDAVATKIITGKFSI